MDEETLFHRAIEMPAAERSAFLDRACGIDSGLRQRVQTLLQAHDEPASFLDPPAGIPPTLDPPTLLTPAGTVIGRYKILESIGEGGYGTVFMAEQTSPVHRKVALKIIKAGMDTRQVIARFEAERQALALMDHPNIARVFDAGVTDTGRPYFVMELVKGSPITRYCDEHRLPPRSRLELFIQVCQAVQHAHQKGIIHRDLKPTNVLVAQYDGKPVPKVIDFGVAKATGPRLTDSTMFTGFGDVIGTPQYMSPEQAQLNQLDIDTRSDIYSLGVLLYELMTGTTPLEQRRVREAALLEVLRVIREEEPPSPSTRLTATEELPSIAARRGLEPKKLSGLVRGELDWIIMKALEKDRARRYETANGFARDVERYLSDEPVQACPPTLRYRFRKFARRNKGALVTTGLVAACLCAGIALLAVSNVRLKAEEARTRAEEQRAQEQLRRADANLAVALEALDEVYMREIESRRYRQRQLSPQDREFLQKGLSFYEQFARENGAHVMLQKEAAKADRRLGFLRRELGQPREAEAAFSKAIPVLKSMAEQSPTIVDHRRELAQCLYGCSLVKRDLDRLEEADRMVRQAITEWEDLVAGPSGVREDRVRLGHSLWHLAHLDAARQRYDESERAFVRALTLFEKLHTEIPLDRFYRQEIAFTHRAMADVLYSPSGRHSEAIQHAHRAVEIYRTLSREEPSSTWFLGEWAFALRALVNILTAAHQPEQAEEVRQQLVEVQDKLVAGHRVAAAQRPGDPWTHHFLGNALAAQGRLADAEAAYREALRLDPNDAGHHQNLADVFRSQRKFVEAAAEYREAARLSSDPFASYHGLGSVYAYLGQWDKAAPAFEQAAKRAPGDPWCLMRSGSLSLAAQRTAFYRLACREMLDRFGDTDDPNIAERAAKLAALAPDFGADPERVTTLIARALSGTESHPDRLWFEVANGLVEYRAGREQRAIEIIRATKPPSGVHHHRDVIAFAILAMAAQRVGHTEAAQLSLSSARELLSKHLPEVDRGETFGDDWHDWLQAQLLIREAEQVLKESANGAVTRDSTKH